MEPIRFTDLAADLAAFSKSHKLPIRNIQITLGYSERCEIGATLETASDHLVKILGAKVIHSDKFNEYALKPSL